MIGGNHQIVYAQDIVDPVFRSIRTPGDSDALSVCQINIVRVSDQAVLATADHIHLLVLKERSNSRLTIICYPALRLSSARYFGSHDPAGSRKICLWIEVS